MVTLNLEAVDYWAPFPVNRSKRGHINVRGRIVEGEGTVAIHMNTGRGPRHGSYPPVPDKVVEIDLTLDQAHELAEELIKKEVELRSVTEFIEDHSR